MKSHVSRIINEWNPMGLLPFCPPDEYEPEIDEIVRLLPRAESDDQLATIIDEVFRYWFGNRCPCNYEACLGAAILIRRLPEQEGRGHNE